MANLHNAPTANADLQARLDAVSAIARAVNLSLPLSELLDLIAETTCKVMGYDFCGIVLADPESDLFLIEGSYGLSRSYIEQVNAGQPYRPAYFLGRPTTATDLDSSPDYDERWLDLAQEQGYRSILNVPVISQEKALGVLNCYTIARHEFSPDEIAVVETIANQTVAEIEAARLYAREQATIKQLERADEIHRDLTRVALNDEGLHSIAATLARLLQCTVIVEDADSSVYVSITQDGSPESASPSLPRSTKSLSATRRTVELAPDPNSGLIRNSLVTPILIAGELAGRVWALNLPDSTGALDRRAIEHGATAIALEILKQRRAQEVEWRLRGDLLGDLLSGEYGEAAAPLARAAYLGHDLNAPHVLCVIKLDTSPDAGEMPADDGEDGGTRRHLMSMVQRAVLRLGLHALVTSRFDYVVIFMASQADESTTVLETVERIRTEVTRDLDNRTMSIAVSAPSSYADQLASAFRETRGALDLLQRLGVRDRSISVEQLGVHRLLLQVEQPQQLVRFANQILDRIVEYDERHNSELFRTLNAFIDQNCSTVRTAESLLVHPHTLSYRLRRIEELTGIDVRQVDGLIQMRLALLVRDMLSP